jgi:hypothetical protein
MQHTGMVDNAEMESPSAYNFHLVTKKRVWSFCADNQEDREEWLESLRECLRSALRSALARAKD